MRSERGFSLLETMIALLIMLMILLSVAQLFGMSMAVNKAADDTTQVTSLASEMMEQLKYRGYDGLTAGGSLTTDVGGYFDSPNVDEDAEADGDQDRARGAGRGGGVAHAADSSSGGSMCEAISPTMVADGSALRRSPAGRCATSTTARR